MTQTMSGQNRSSLFTLMTARLLRSGKPRVSGRQLGAAGPDKFIVVVGPIDGDIV
jgi:hypothetical protein